MTTKSSSLVPSAPRDVLLDAVIDFQAALSDEERQELRKMRTIPDADSILVFTAELDSTHRTRRGPSYASRLHTVLSSVGVFCGVIDTFVSSHPEIAALVWGSVRLTMMMAANITSYYQPTSDLFMRLGRLCPLFADYQALYPDSVRLQKALVDFHASIIRCCRHVMQVLRRPLHQHILKSILSSFEQEFKPDVNEVQRYSDSIEHEIHFAKAQADRQDQQLQAMERQEASKSRILIDRFTGRADEKLRRMQEMQLQRDERESRKRKQQLLDLLSTGDYLRLYKQSCRKRWQDTASWIFQLPEFVDWLHGTKPVLWCSGRIGSGKTITTASVIQYILLLKDPDGGPVAFYFGQSTGSDSLSACEILKSILQQKLDLMNVTDEVENALRKLDTSSGTDDVLNLLRQSSTLGPSYIIIDGVDECPKPERRALFTALSSLISSDNNLRLFLCGRTSIQDEIERHFKQVLQISLNCQSTNDDITRYIEGIIDNKLEDGDLRVQDPSLVNEIKTALSQGAQGMFIWAFFQVEEISSQPSDEGIRTALRNLPKDLNAIFNRALCRIRNGTYFREAQKLFLYVSAAKRHMTLDELHEAIAIVPNQQFSEPDRQCNSMDKISSWCENLVEVEEESKLVHFAHHSVRTFLLEKDTDATLMEFHLGLDEANNQLGEISLTYLNFNDFKTALITQPKPLSIRNPIAIVQATAKPGSKLATVYSSAIKPGQKAFDLRRAIDPDGGAAAIKISRALIREHPFMKYASEHWIHHTRFLRNRKSRAWMILRQVVSAKLSFSILPWTGDSQALEWAKQNRHYAILRLLWRGKSDALFKWAVDNDDLQLFDILIDDLLDDTPADDIDYGLCSRILLYAASVGHVGAIDKLRLPRRITADKERFSALTTAARKGRVDMVDKLLNLGRGGGHLEVVDRLLLYGADMNGAPAALPEAASEGHLSVVDRLIRAGADVNGKAGVNSPLVKAAKGGHLDVVEMLLAAGADANGTTAFDTALTAAASRGHLSVIDTLLSAGANMDTQTTRPRTVLHMVVEKRRLDCIEALVAAGVNTDAVDADGRTALHIAAKLGDLQIVEMLYGLGNALNAQDHDGNTALHLAVQNRDMCTVSMLARASTIDKSITNHLGLTAMGLIQRFGIWEQEAWKEYLV
ncbi:Vegetative incompatibility protein HET-E-1 [Apiospora rasikravindrae]|uniref:Vegetative incompatibility protein HET-E-1 n=1 Tax=Apiospora rasikravindrae TaxID=990691 RepID=A0ABR1S0J2_9PEZI